MRTMKLFLAGAILATMVSCTGGQKKTDAQQQDSLTVVAPDMHTSEISLDYFGMYEGTLPCADCEGIKTTLTLNEDKTFVLTSEYLGKKKDNKFEEKGSYTIEDGEIAVVKICDIETNYYKLQEGSLAMLTSEKKMVEGELAPNYILTKK